MKIYTIGHSTMTEAAFIALLKQWNINCVADVRSTPYSQYALQFNRESIRNTLKDNGIAYVFMGKELGARREDPALYQDGIVDFQKVSADPDFLEGIRRLKSGLEKGLNIALMCAEKEPSDCHRCILVGHFLSGQPDIEVLNILTSGMATPQEEVDKKLLDRYFPRRAQIDMFENNNYDEHALLEEAYRLHPCRHRKRP